MRVRFPSSASGEGVSRWIFCSRDSSTVIDSHRNGLLAQLVERRIEDPIVRSSILWQTIKYTIDYRGNRLWLLLSMLIRLIGYWRNIRIGQISLFRLSKSGKMILLFFQKKDDYSEYVLVWVLIADEGDPWYGYYDRYWSVSTESASWGISVRHEPRHDVKPGTRSWAINIMPQ